MEGGWCPADGAETAVQEATRGLAAGGSRSQPPTRAHQAAGALWRWEAPGRGEAGHCLFGPASRALQINSLN